MKKYRWASAVPRNFYPGYSVWGISTEDVSVGLGESTLVAILEARIARTRSTTND